MAYSDADLQAFAAGRAMLAALLQASDELEDRIDCDDGTPNWAMRLKTEIDAAITRAKSAGFSPTE